MRRKQKNQQEKVILKGRKSAPFSNLSKIPPFTRFLVFSFIVIHAGLRLFLSPASIYDVFYTFGFAPAQFTHGLAAIPPLTFLSPLTHLFIHGNWMHLFFNSFAMLTFGMFFEKEFGSRATIFFFFVCGIAGAAFYLILNPFSTIPIIGASGSVSGLFGAMTIILFQRRPLGLRISRHGPWPLIAFWVLFMVGMGMLNGDAWQAHIGGFLSGIGLLHLLQKGKLKF
jgi:membrane associated rhomboid family serine protease